MVRSPDRPGCRRFARARLLIALLTCLLAAPAFGQDETLVDRPVSDVRLEGISRVDETLIRNTIRITVGDPYDADTIATDVRRLTRLAQFRTVDARGELQPDGTVAVIFSFNEQPIVQIVQVVGNRLVSDQELAAAIRIRPGDPRDDFRIQNARQAVEELYRKRGHYLTTLTVDESELEENGILIFRVIEGPRVRVKAIAFRGNRAISNKVLNGQIETRTSIFLFRKGVLDEDVLIADVAAIDRYYKDRGYLDVRVDYEVQLRPDDKEAKVLFHVEEGKPYLLRAVTAENRLDGGPPEVFTEQQLAAMIQLRPGDIYRADGIRKSRTTIREAYLNLGYLDVRVDPLHLRYSATREVDLHLSISAGPRYRVGMIEIAGNFLTKDKVIRRDIRLEPGRPFDGQELEEMELRLRRTRLFGNIHVTPIEPEDPDDPYRDYLVEIEEQNTGAVNFGAGVGSDSGLFGEISINQRNFDVTDLPQSIDELIKAEAFRGAGQNFNMVFRPGTEFFLYQLSLTEPHIMESDYALSVSGSYFQRDFEFYTQNRTRGAVTLNRQLGDIWTVGFPLRVERVELSDIDATAPAAVFGDAGPDMLTGAGISLARTTISTITRPGRGSRFEIGWEQVGFLGDVDFGRISGEYTVFLTLDEDFLGRKTTLRLRTGAGYIFGGRAPTYERFYLGGRTLRGFDFRTVSPKGLDLMGNQTDEPIGGNFQFYAGAQYEYPIFDDAFTGVVFIDSGTVTDDIGFDPYRVGVGLGVRIYIPALGPAPLAFDFAWPLRKDILDDAEVFSFTAEVPF